MNKSFLIPLLVLFFIPNLFAFEYSEENMTLNADFIFTAESYLHTDQDNLNWVYDFYDREPVINMSLDFTFYDYFSAVAEFPLMKDRLVAENSTTNYSNIFFNASELDLNFPNVAYITAGTDNLSLSIGRDLLTLGHGLLLSPNTFYHDYIQLLTSWEYFNYGLTFLTLNEIDVEPDETDSRVVVEKYLIAHEFGVKLFDSLSISIIESVMLQGLPFEFGYLNPFIFLHDEFLSLSEFANAFSTLNVDYKYSEFITFYGELAVDQYATTYENDNYDQVEPNAIGWLVGLEGYIPVKDYTINIDVSFTHTDPFLGLDSSGVNFTSTTNYVTHSQGDLDNANGIAVTDFLGVGPDREIFEITTDIIGFKKVSLGLDYQLLLLGENVDIPEEGNEDDFELTTPSGNVEIYNILTLRSGYTFNENTELSGQLSYINQDNNIDFQLILSLSHTI